jgi:ornithine carbamoyltransferase
VPVMQVSIASSWPKHPNQALFQFCEMKETREHMEQAYAWTGDGVLSLPRREMTSGSGPVRFFANF